MELPPECIYVHLRREGGKERRREGSWVAYREKEGDRRKICSLKNLHKKLKTNVRVEKKDRQHTSGKCIYLFFFQATLSVPRAVPYQRKRGESESLATESRWWFNDIFFSG